MTDRTEGIAGQVDPANAGQLRAWDGDQGAYWTERAERFDEGVARYHERFIAAAAIEPESDVLDIGCGSGRTTRDAARAAPAGSALGVDLSSRMIDLARRTAEREHLANVTFRQADAQVHPFTPAGVDVAISRHGAMFFGDPEAAFTNIARALRPGGRLVLLTWQPMDRNAWMSTFRSVFAGGRELPAPAADGPGPAALSEPGTVRALLESAGFADVRLDALHEPMYFGRDVDDACRFISGQFAAMAAELDAEARARALELLRADMAGHLTGEGVRYDSAAWLVRARRP
ncbi:SAM-dependent methyltransferase [Amycolatopsis antarctica]|uniref:SAM-dependent methyltransferase n=1 Tax=Amycolatopsis antarctica TaxID=1854586 RepID=A0A263D3H8_9PSEU|nr:class I SAM-dependent methyltransferase [Amycolatopsis antarctica]OZM72177.1 SAM-dependent methyltransferase [Amycolatopsis antarctica]